MPKAGGVTLFISVLFDYLQKKSDAAVEGLTLFSCTGVHIACR